jgi:glycosidase
VRIYQLFVRLFGNTNTTCQPNGTAAENGVGKFNDINEAALAALREMGFTHIWLTGVLRQATATGYPGLPADDADLLKGLAGSPYAIKDYFDVCPDYAVDPANRLAEFKALLDRIHEAGLKALIDLVPNHVARSYCSTVMPDLDFGAADDRTKFFDPKNNFFYLTPGPDGPPLRLPTVRDGVPLTPTCKAPGMRCDGLFEGEMQFGRVTGNNAPTWSPDIHDWYETVKLNYGWDFTANRAAYPRPGAPDLPIPDTWLKMDRVIAHWQTIGVDGFRCDMSHMVPREFWAWLIGKARERQAAVYFIAEAYDNDPAKIPGTGGKNVMIELLEAGFDAVYDDPTYKTIKKIYDGPGWANDIDAARGDDAMFRSSLRYAENHDEVRLAAEGQWGSIGMEAGRAICGILYGLGRGPVMLYNGQEVGEPGSAPAGFGGGNARTTIFDYWAMPELAKWVNGHRYDGGSLSQAQRDLRLFYTRLLRLIGEPAFRDGGFFPLNPANNANLLFGCHGDKPAGGQWIYAFLRHDPASGQSFLVVANLHKSKAFTDMPILFPREAIEFLGLETNKMASLHFMERIEGQANFSIAPEEFQSNLRLEIPKIPPLTPCYFEIVTC